jgi:hypothetical protein
VPFLPTEALDIHDRQPEDLDLGQRGFDGFQPLRLDNGDDQLHGAVTPKTDFSPLRHEGTGDFKKIRRWRRLPQMSGKVQQEFISTSHRFANIRAICGFFSVSLSSRPCDSTLFEKCGLKRNAPP